MIGISGRMFLGDSIVLTDSNQETISISMVAKIFPVFIAGIFLSLFWQPSCPTGDSQLLVTSSALTEDFYHNKVHKTQARRELMWVSRWLGYGGSNVAVLIATNW